MPLAWAPSAIVGIPALLIAAWGLAGGYSFKYLPFLLVPVAIPFAAAPQLAAMLMLVTGRLRFLTVPTAIILSLLMVAAPGVATLALLFTLPLSLLDDSGHAADNFTSLLVALMVLVLYLGAAVIFLIALISWGRRGNTPVDWRTVLGSLGVVSISAAVVIGLAAVGGALNAARHDSNGIPIGYVSGSWLAGRPESSLLYPQADVVSKGVTGEERELRLSRPATSRTVFFTFDASGQVPAWYAEQLAKSGWRHVDLIGTAIEEQNWAFKRGDRELFELFLYRASGYGAFPDQAQHPGERRFETDYLVFAPGEPHV